jgi:hypothetical protein
LIVGARPKERRAKGADQALRRSESSTIIGSNCCSDNNYCMQILLYFLKIVDNLEFLAPFCQADACCCSGS